MFKSVSLGSAISPLVGPLLQAFFVDHLYSQKRASPRTVQSYRDTFRLLLWFLRETTGKEPTALVMPDIDAPTVLRFLDYVEGERRIRRSPETFGSLRSARSAGWLRFAIRSVSVSPNESRPSLSSEPTSD